MRLLACRLARIRAVVVLPDQVWIVGGSLPRWEPFCAILVRKKTAFNMDQAIRFRIWQKIKFLRLRDDVVATHRPRLHPARKYDVSFPSTIRDQLPASVQTDRKVFAFKLSPGISRFPEAKAEFRCVTFWCDPFFDRVFCIQGVRCRP